MHKENLVKRNAAYDNAKGILIILVVIGHFIVPFTSSSKLMLTIRESIYLFHMPAFLVLSGMFQANRIKEHNLIKPIEKFLIPFLLQNTLLIILLLACRNSEVSGGVVLKGYWSFWYILAIFVYYLITIKLSYKQRKTVVIGSILFSIVAGFFNNVSLLNFTKLIVFYPFFIVGYYYKNIIDSIRKSKIKKLLSFLIFSVIIILSIVFEKYINIDILSGITSYEELSIEYGVPYALFSRVQFIVVGLLCSFTFICMIPDKKTYFTNIGKYSLYVFVLHNYVLVFFYFFNRKLGYISRINSNTEYFLFFILCILLSYILCLKRTRACMKWLVEPDIDLKRILTKISD